MQLIKNLYLVSGFPYGKHPNVYVVKGENLSRRRILNKIIYSHYDNLLS